MRRRDFIKAIAGSSAGVAGLARLARAGAASKTWRIG
jgi:hypothetical protein